MQLQVARLVCQHCLDRLAGKRQPADYFLPWAAYLIYDFGIKPGACHANKIACSHHSQVHRCRNTMHSQMAGFAQLSRS